MCRGYAVNEIFVSSLICRKSNYLNEKVTRTNFLLNLICEENRFVFIDNRNININNLWKDGLHLIEQGKAVLYIFQAVLIDNQYTIVLLQKV